MIGLLIALLFVWLVLIVVGFAIKALLWLAIVGIALFVITALGGAIHHSGKP